MCFSNILCKFLFCASPFLLFPFPTIFVAQMSARCSYRHRQFRQHNFGIIAFFIVCSSRLFGHAGPFFSTYSFFLIWFVVILQVYISLFLVNDVLISTLVCSLIKCVFFQRSFLFICFKNKGLITQVWGNGRTISIKCGTAIIFLTVTYWTSQHYTIGTGLQDTGRHRNLLVCLIKETISSYYLFCSLI